MILLGLLLLVVPFALPIAIAIAQGRIRLRLDALEEAVAEQGRAIHELTRRAPGPTRETPVGPPRVEAPAPPTITPISTRPSAAEPPVVSEPPRAAEIPLADRPVQPDVQEPSPARIDWESLVGVKL